MASDDELIEAAPCPSCRSPLTVSAADLGHLVECPGCGTQFRARRTAPATELPAPPRPQWDDRPPSLRDRDREEDDDPRAGRPADSASTTAGPTANGTATTTATRRTAGGKARPAVSSPSRS